MANRGMNLLPAGVVPTNTAVLEAKLNETGGNIFNPGIPRFVKAVGTLAKSERLLASARAPILLAAVAPVEVAPVPPFATAIAVPFHTPVAIVPSDVNDDAVTPAARVAPVRVPAGAMVAVIAPEPLGAIEAPVPTT